MFQLRSVRLMPLAWSRMSIPDCNPSMLVPPTALVPASPWLLRDMQIDDIRLLNYSPAPAIVAPRAAV